MKLLHVTSDWKWTGPAEPMLHAVVGLRARGHECDLICPAEPQGAAGALLARARERGVEPVLRLRPGQGYRPWRDRAEVQRLRAVIAEGRYDCVHTHHTRDLLLCRAALRRLSAHHVASWHRGEPIPPRWWNRRVWGPGRLAGLTVLSRGLAAQAVDALGWPPERVLPLAGVVDTERFVPRPRSKELARDLGLEPDHRVLGIVARLQPHRRFELLLETLDRVRHELPALRLLVVGRGTRAQQVLHDPVSRLGLDKVVVHAGYRRDDYLDVLAQMDALVFLVPGSDGSCRAVLEAMAMQIPVIATRRGVLPEIVPDPDTGRLIDETPDSLAAALRDFCADPPGWSARGQAARHRILTHHTIPHHAEQLECFYGQLRVG